MKTYTLKADRREILGRRVKILRSAGVLPGNLYGKKVASEALKVNLGEFEKVFREAGETQIVELNLGKAKKPVLIHNVQQDPVTDTVIHVDFLQIDLKEKVTAQVPVELIGTSPAEKEGKGIVVQQIDEIEVEALPTDLPEKFEVDISALANENESILIKDLKVDSKKIEIKNSPDQVIVKVEQPKQEEEIVSTATTEGAETEEEVEEEKEESGEDKTGSQEKIKETPKRE